MDPAMGPVVVFGAGGVMAEWLADISVRLAPVSVMDAREMIFETKISRMLAGWRGAPAGDVESLAKAISAISTFACADGKAREFEVNPLRVLPRGVLALDALITG